jgi:hypothetical protein
MSDEVSRGQQAADELAQRWIAAMQAMADQIQRQQQTMQESINSYIQLLNAPPSPCPGRRKKASKLPNRPSSKPRSGGCS